MTRTSESSHVLKLIPDYALGLLSVEDARWVDAHVAACQQCRRAFNREQFVSRSVKATIAAVARPNHEELRHLMPAGPLSGGSGRLLPHLSPGIAAAAFMILLVLGAFAFITNQHPDVLGIYSSTARSTLVVLTDTPTQSATREVTATAEAFEAIASPSSLESAQGDYPIPPAPALIPVPAASQLRQ